MVQNLTRLSTDEIFNLNDSNCKYYMELCFSFAENLDCSLLDRQSLTWGIRPGESKILKIYDDVVPNVFNPLRFRLSTWKAVSCGIMGRYFILQESNHPKCVSYSYTVRACLIVTVHGSISCADPLRPARRSTYRIMEGSSLQLCTKLTFFLLGSSVGSKLFFLEVQYGSSLIDLMLLQEEI